MIVVSKFDQNSRLGSSRSTNVVSLLHLSSRKSTMVSICFGLVSLSFTCRIMKSSLFRFRSFLLGGVDAPPLHFQLTFSLTCQVCRREQFNQFIEARRHWGYRV